MGAFGSPINEIDRYLRTNEVVGPPSGTGPAFGQGPDSPNYFFVDAANGSDTNDGRDPRTPLLMIQAALDKCVSGRGDRVYVMPGSYDENLTLEGKDYVSIIGVLLPGYARPDVVPTTGVALDCDTSQGLVLARMRFYSADADVIQLEGNGFLFDDVVLDGDTGQAATEALLRLKGNATDDSYTASEGRIRNTLFRLSNGYGVAIDEAPIAAAGVGSTHLEFEECRFIDNAAEDIIALATESGGVYSLQDSLFKRCYFMYPDKTTYVDIETNNAAGNTGNMFAECFFNTDDLTATNFKAAATKVAIVGCYDKVGVEDASGLD